MADPEDLKTPTATVRGDTALLQSGRRQDFTYRRFDGLHVQKLDLRQSLFIGSLIEDCAFTDVDFSRCDFSGTKIVRCAFKDCVFSLADVRSCRVDDARFAHCDFKTSQLSRNDWRGTIFDTCSFERGTVLEGAFVDSEIRACSFKGASVTSVDFERCAFEDTGLADCTALFLFFDACRFERFTINAETIGFTYGIGRSDLEEMRLVHLGDRQEAPPPGDDLVEALASSYEARRWYVGVATLDLNFALVPTVAAVSRLSGELSELTARGLSCDLDELDFVVRVLERLERDGGLPLLAARRFGRVLQNAFPERGERSERLLRRVERLILSMLDAACDLIGFGEASGAVTVEFRMIRRPPRPLDALCFDVLQAIHGPAAPLLFLSGREGSWIEVWQTVPSVLATVQLVLLAVNGLLKEFNKTIENGRRLSRNVNRRKAPASKAALAKRSGRVLADGAGDGVAAQIISTRRRALLLTDEALRRVDATLDVIEAKAGGDLVDLQAYAGGNVLEVDVRPAPKAARRSPRRTAPAV